MTANLTRSRGIALIAGLMLMASMVVLALALATGALLERRMAGNFGDRQLALSRAHLAQRWGEHWLFSQATNPLDPACITACESPVIHAPGTLPASPEFEDTEWWSLNARLAGTQPATGYVHMDYSLPGTETPRWLIEEMHIEPLDSLPIDPGSSEPELAYYRILARGTGRLPGSIAVTESIIARPWIDTIEPSPLPPGAASTWFCESVTADVHCGRMSWRRRR